MATTQTGNEQTEAKIVTEVKGYELAVGMEIVDRTTANGLRATKTTKITKVERMGKYDTSRVLVNNHDVYSVVSPVLVVL